MDEQLPWSKQPEPTEPSDSGMAPVPELDDEAFAHLRAADPAATAVPDEVRLAAVLRAATGVDTTRGRDAEAATPVVGILPSGTSSEGRQPAAVPAGPALEAARRRWGLRGTPARWLQVAAVVVALAVVGGGGYALGTRHDGSSTAGTGGTPLPAIALGGGPERSGSDAAAPAVGSATSGSASSSSIAVGGTGVVGGTGYRTVFTASGLSTAGGQSSARAFDAASVVSAATVRHAAAVLGVAGEPTAQWGTWTVGSLDGTGAVLTLSADGTATLSYSDPAWDPWTCSGLKSSVPGKACGKTVPSAPTGDAAVTRVRALFRDLGVDLAGATAAVRTDSTPVKDGTGADVPAASRVTVTFSQVVDGQLTGITWSATLVGSGVQSLWGPLAPLVDLGRYDVISPAAAVDRLNDPRFGVFGGAVPMMGVGVAESGAASSGGASTGAVAPGIPSSGSVSSGTVSSDSAAGSPGSATGSSGSAGAGTATAGPATAGPGVVAPAPAVSAVPGGKPVPVPVPSATADPVAPTTPSAGSAIAWPVRHVTIVSARLGLAVTTLQSGAAVLVPAYQLTDADGGTWSVIAVVDSRLDLTSAG